MTNQNKSMTNIEDPSGYQKFKMIALRYYRVFCRAMSFKNAYFFDTNMVISNSTRDSRLIKLFTMNRRYFLTESNDVEIKTFLNNGDYRKINRNKFKIISFDELRQINPEICPLYYNFILQMNNPAVPYSPDFFAYRINAVLARNGKLSDKDKKIQKKVSMMLSEFNKNVDDGIQNVRNKSPLLFRNLPKSSDVKFHKKKRQAILKDDQNYFNDLRSLSLALVYCLTFQENTTFVTSDSDIMNQFFILIEAICYQCALKVEVLPMLTEKMKEGIVKGDKIKFDINIWKVTGERINLARNLHSDFKKHSFLFRVKFWSIEEQRYYNIDSIFDEPLKMLFLNSTGPYNCPAAKNHEVGKWLHFKYFWPPEDIKDGSHMKVEVSRKPLIKINNLIVDNRYHNSNCLYVEEDRKNNFKFFLSFEDTSKF